MSWLADLPVQRKLRFAMLLTSVVALLLACGFFLAFEYVGFQRGLVRTMETLARVTAANSSAAIAFDDAEDAQETLEALRAEPQVLAAALYDAQGRPFAAYSRRPGEVAPSSSPQLRGAHVANGEVIHVEPVVQDGRQLGTVYLRGSLAQLYQRMQVYGLAVAAVLTASLLLAWILASVLQRTLARPILELASTAKAIAGGSDYSLRARRYGRDELGSLTTAFNTMLDRTQGAVDALRESEARFRHMADGAPVQIWLADEQGAYLWVNQRWLDFSGRSLDQEIGEGWWDRVHQDDRPQRERVYREAAARRQTFQTEYRLRRRDGTYRWMLDHGIPRFSAAAEFGGYIGSCIDVTDRKQAEEEVADARDRAVAASRAKDDFLARLSHELRTPLNPVLLVASEAARDSSLDELVRADFEMIAKNVALEARLIDDLLDLTKIVRGKLALELKPQDLNGILRDALATVGPELTAKGLALDLALSADHFTVLADPVRLQQVFWNLLKNAVKFTEAGGRVRIETRSLSPGHRVAVTVSDTGYGLTGEELSRVFDAFSQGEHAEIGAPHRFGGLGLGLAISRMLVELHGGSIAAASGGRQQGATFRVELPLLENPPPRPGRSAEVDEPARERAAATAPAAAAATTDEGAVRAAAERGTVLVVEDHLPTCQTLAHLLRRRGFKVVTAGSVHAAREAAQQHVFTFIVSDIGLPDGDGYELMKELRTTQAQVPGVALSGYGMEQDVARSREAGFLDHLTKPISVEALDGAIERLLRAEQP